MTETALDQAHAAMTAAPEDDAARLRFFGRLGEAELFLLLQSEAEGDEITPEVFDTGAHTLVLVFDREERLAQFVGRTAPYAAVSGRALAQMLAAQGLGLVLNPEVAPSSFVLAPEGVAWLADVLQEDTEEIATRIAELVPPSVPDILVAALDAKLATGAGLARMAYLAGTGSDTGASGHLLGFVDVQEGAEAALAQAVREALLFSGIEAGALDVGFFRAQEAMSARLAKVGLRFDLPQAAAGLERTAPGMDPERPPILK